MISELRIASGRTSTITSTRLPEEEQIHVNVGHAAAREVSSAHITFRFQELIVLECILVAYSGDE